MARAPFQVLIFPYRQRSAHQLEYAIFCRVDDSCWQGIAGGGEDQETPLAAAKRESREEAGIAETCEYLPLDSVTSLPVMLFSGNAHWGDQLYVLPEYSFGVAVGSTPLTIADEHQAYRWVTFAEALEILTYDSNKTALWELNRRVLGNRPTDD